MGEKIYGCDLDGKITSQDVVKALNECFYRAHCADASLGGGEEIDRDYCESMIKKAFTQVGGDYNNPTKDSILKVMEYLQDFAKNFRDPSVIQKHASQIMKLVDKL